MESSMFISTRKATAQSSPARRARPISTSTCPPRLRLYRCLTKTSLIVVVLASFVTQAHVGFAPVAVALCALSLSPLVRRTGQSFQKTTGAERFALALLLVVILQVVWLPTFAEELTGHPGNLTKLWRFFAGAAETQPVNATVNAWGSMLSGVIRPGLRIPRGWGLGESSIFAILVALLSSIVGLPLLIILRWRNGDRFESAIAGVSLVASVIGIWSVNALGRLRVSEQTGSA
jgi:hypothetical protein